MDWAHIGPRGLEFGFIFVKRGRRNEIKLYSSVATAAIFSLWYNEGVNLQDLYMFMACKSLLLLHYFERHRFQFCPRPRFNIKMLSYQYRKFNCGDKTVVRSSYFHNGISYAGKTAYLYWIEALMLIYFLYLKAKVMFTCTIMYREKMEQQPLLDSTPTTYIQMENVLKSIFGDRVHPS